MNQQSTPTPSANGHSSASEIFALTDEQILEIDPEPQDVQLSAAGSGAQPSIAESTPTTTPTNNAAQNTPGPFTTPEDARVLAELYPGGLTQAKTAAERARTLDEIDAAYFGGEGNSPEQISAARAQLAQRLLREDPVAFREMVFEGLRALEAVETPGRARSVADALGRTPATVTNAARTTSGNKDAGGAPPILAVPNANNVQAELAAPPQHLAAEARTSPATDHAARATGHELPVTSHQSLVSAYGAFEKAANEELERRVGGAIDRALHQALPNLGRGEESANAGARHKVPLQARLGAAIRDEVEKALQGDRQLGEQVAQILSARRFDNETRAQVVRLIGERAQQLVPSAAKRALNDWTQTTLAAHRARTRHADANTSRVDLSPATGQGSAGQAVSARAASARSAHAPKSSRVDYRKLSDDQILDL